MDEVIKNETNILLGKIFELLEDNKKCSSLYRDELEKKFLDVFLSFLERAYENKMDSSLSLEFKYEDIFDDLEILVDSLNITYYKPEIKDNYDKFLHNPIGKEPTEDRTLDMKIFKCLSNGFKTDTIILKPANVIVYKYFKKEDK